jgi:hypothetical protein
MIVGTGSSYSAPRALAVQPLFSTSDTVWALASIGRSIKMNKDNSFFIVVILFYYYIRYLSAIKNLFQSDLWIALSEDVFLQLEFAMLDG